MCFVVAIFDLSLFCVCLMMFCGFLSAFGSHLPQKCLNMYFGLPLNLGEGVIEGQTRIPSYEAYAGPNKDPCTGPL